MNLLRADAGFYKHMLRLALPIALQNLLMASFQLIDASMVSKLGDAAMAGVSMSGRWSFILMITLFGVNSGGAILYSQYRGVRDDAGIRHVYGLAVLNTAGLVLLFAAAMLLFPETLVRVFAGDANPAAVEQGVAYMRVMAINCLVMGFNFATTIMLRSTEEVRVPLLTSLVAITVNTGFNYLMIYGKLGFPRLGVRGAAIATLISSAVQMALLIIVLRKKKHPVFMKLRDLFAIPRGMAPKFYRVAYPVFINEVFWSLGTSTYMFVFGRTGGVSGVPAYSLYTGVDQLLFAFVIGLSSACGVMVGKAVGAGEEQTAWNYAKRFLLLGTAFSLLMGAAEALLSGPVISLINPANPATGELAKRLVQLGAINLPLRMLSMLLIVSIFRAGGKPMLGAVIDVSCVWLVGAPAVLLAGFVFHLPFLWMFVLTFSEEAVKVVVGIVFFLRRKWMKNLTDGAVQPDGAKALRD